MSPMQWALYAELRHAQRLVYHLAHVAVLVAPAASQAPPRSKP